ncbi:hypothetical protein [Fimbriiglobus ruber]|uniref:Phage protein n=1 Tax=Fimbriiglobus ruber TaxID=1908690 RepID=A0A225D8X0_9BACT|nr:hypothetical protein [Fimbriiglobus ruber]OWK37902.1 hypothetical protein FRUB_07022 [Fimbriiglobus ruber]
MVEDLIYGRLNDTSITSLGAAIYATDPNENAPLPFISFSITDNQQTVTLSGLAAQNQYMVDVHVWGTSLYLRNQMLDAVKGRLQNYSGGYFQGVFLQNESTETIGSDEEGVIYHAVQTYKIFIIGTPISATPDPMATITNLNGEITMTVPGHQLILSDAGLTLDGQSLVAGSIGQTYVYNQVSPATTWTINHNLGNYQSVSVIDSGGTNVIGSYAWPNSNSTILTFFAPFSGTAYLNY